MTLQKHIAEVERSGLFDKDWYRKQYSEHLVGVENLIGHYLVEGAQRGFNPSPHFDTRAYLSLYKDVAKAGMNPLLHYCKSGQKEGRSPIGVEKKGALSVASHMKRLPRFGGSEYGKIDFQIPFDEAIEFRNGEQFKLCVHLHLFHVNMAGEFAKYLNFIKVPFTLLISVPSVQDLGIADFFKSTVAAVDQCIAKVVENRGRDVSSWVVYFHREIRDHDLFLHLHSKKSDYNAAYNGWRKFLLHNTVGSETVVAYILNLFAKHETIGLVYPPYFSALPGQPKWGANRDIASRLANRLGLPSVPAECPDFPSGSFFWCRVKCLMPLLSAELSGLDFDEEKGQLDGTLAHAIERLLGIMPKHAGMSAKCVGVDVSYNLVNYWDNKRFSGLTDKPVECCTAGGKATQLSDKLSRYKIAVFTCVTGGFDELVPPLVVEQGIDYLFFSDKPVTAPEPYQFRNCRYIDPNPRRTARFLKTHPHFHLRDYDFVVWIDGNIIAMGGFSKYIEMVIDNHVDLGLIAHPIRLSFAAEADECIRIGADDAKVMEEQKQTYLASGLAETGLIETNIIISTPKRPKTKQFYDIWWREMCRFSYRDQISVNFALRASGISYMHLFEQGISARDHPDFCVLSHDLTQRKQLIDYLANLRLGKI